MKKLLVFLVAALALFAPAAATAHPLGNFTVNRYAELVAAGDRLYVVYVLDMAEIPAFQARRDGVKADEYATRLGERLALHVDGRRASLRPVARTVRFPRGAGGLRTLRVEVLYRGPRLAGDARVELRDRNYGDRLGWREIVVRAEAGARISESTVPTRTATDRLRRYPKDLLSSPLEVESAAARVEPGEAGAPRPTLAGSSVADDRSDSGFAGLVERDFGPLGLVAALAAVLFWGAAHALSPGHGKAIVTAYLVGSRGAPRHAFALGGIVTVTHTIGVFALGVVTLALSQFIVPEQLYPWLGLVSGLLVVAIGASVLHARWQHRRAHAHGAHTHHHHAHGGGHHDHAPAEPRWRGVVAVGISGGLLPCPSALVVLLAAISLHKVALGLLLIVAFSVGLATTVTGIGLVALLARRAFQRVDFDGRVARLLPALSALVIVLAGVAMTLRAVPDVL
ncbi:MAG: sulfite exporter TauE/SafE family protein [Thermoleophilia bacterium]|nr:sulfite exporter TauE/SafE family protein [Thermoleophilia bacterium]